MVNKRKTVRRIISCILTGCIIYLILSAADGFVQRQLVILIGKAAVNTFCPAVLYERHLYYLDAEKKAADVLFGNAFPIVRFLSAAEDDKGTEGRIDFLFGAAGDERIVTDISVWQERVEDADGQGQEENDRNSNCGIGQDAVGDEDTDGTVKVSEAIETQESLEAEEQPETTEQTTGQETTGQQNEEATDEDNAVHVAGSRTLPVSPVKAYSYSQLSDYSFVHDNFYIIPGHTSLSESVLDPEELLGIDLSISKEHPCILLYHTHSQEAFADSAGDDMTIVQVGDYLEKILTEQYGCEVIHVTEEFDMAEGSLDRSKAYTYAQESIANMLSLNPQVDMVIDLHRDGVNENLHLVTDINGKKTAKVMLFNGISYSNNQGSIDYLYNPYIKENLALTYQMYVLGKNYYPDFFRCIYVEAYRYNLHLCRRSMLIEAGAQTNTFEEVLNAMEPLAELIIRELGGEQIY